MDRNYLLQLVAASLIALPLSTAAFNLPGSLGDIMETATLAKDATTAPSEDQEHEIGQGVAATLLGASSLLDDRAAQNYVNRIGLWIALQSPRPGLPWHFAVLDSDDVNAFAAPGGYVFVTRGLLLRLHSEDELAGVLGHEIAHVVRQHHLRALQKDASLKLAGKAASKVIHPGGLEGEGLNVVAKGAKTLYSRGLDKEDEFEADRIGVVLAARAGYDPYGLPAVLQALDGISPSSSDVSLLFKTHPRPADRFTRISLAMSGTLDSLVTRPPLRDRYFTSLASLLGPPAAAAAEPAAP